MPSLPFRIDTAMMLAPTRTRRLIIAAVIFTFFVFYFRSLSFRTEPEPINMEGKLAKFPQCVSGYMGEIEQLMKDLDAVVTMGKKKPDKFYFVGNGHVASTPHTGAHVILLENGVPLDLGHNINLKYSLRDTSISLAMTVMHMKGGQIDLYYVGEGCVTVKESIFTSQDNPSVIVHDVFIHNPAKAKQLFTVKAGIDSHLDIISNIKVDEKSGVVYSDLVHASNGDSYVAAAASLLTAKSITIEGGKTAKVQLFVSLAAARLPDVGERSEKLKFVSGLVTEDLNKIDQSRVLTQHVLYWSEMRKSGLKLQPLQDHLMAKPLNVKLALYYLLSMYRPGESPPSSLKGCFKGSPSSHSPVLWTPVKSLDSAYTFLSTWLTELKRGGCEGLLTGSRSMFYQALLRSFVGVMESEHGLELALNPHSMEGYITLWGIEYDDTWVDISVAINTPSHAGEVSVSKKEEYSDHPLYTCDQICDSGIITLPSNGQPVKFLIKPTNPSTPILYVASQTKQLIELRQLIEEHHGLDLHSLEEHPISALFIIVISIVIVAFHALLFHMIYKEFCSGDRGSNKSMH